MNLYVIGVNYRTATVQIREKLSFASDEYESALSGIKSLEGVSECAVLSTCNRTELHVFTDKPLKDTGFIEAYLCSLKGLDIYFVKKYFYVYEGMNAVRHIMKVASGMDSMVLGEDQILCQFKKAYSVSMKEGTSKAVLNTLSRLAITSSKKIKTRNLALGKAASIAVKAVEFLAGLLPEGLKDKRILIIGSGEVACLVLKELKFYGAEDIYMTFRSSHGPGNFALENGRASGVMAAAYSERYSLMDICDVVIGATSSPHYTVTSDLLEAAISKHDRKRIFIDLAVPRDFDENIASVCNTKLFNIDDLNGIGIKSRVKLMDSFDQRFIQAQISSYTDEFIRWFNNRKLYINCERI